MLHVKRNKGFIVTYNINCTITTKYATGYT